jgi:hypothetical protein
MFRKAADRFWAAFDLGMVSICHSNESVKTFTGPVRGFAI